MSSDIDICNMALGRAEARSTISSMSEGSAEANACALYYAPTRDALLRAFRWDFARKQLPLALLQSMATVPPGNVPTPWMFEYAYPSDCIKMHYLMPMLDVLPGGSYGSSGPATAVWVGPAVKYIVSTDLDANNNSIKVILTNQSQAIGVYTMQQVNPQLFDSLFVEAFTSLMAWKLATSLSGNKALKEEIKAEAKALVLEAEAANANEGLTQQQYTPDWMKVRGYQSDYASPDLYLWDMDPGSLDRIM